MSHSQKEYFVRLTAVLFLILLLLPALASAARPDGLEAQGIIDILSSEAVAAAIGPANILDIKLEMPAKPGEMPHYKITYSTPINNAAKNCSLAVQVQYVCAPCMPGHSCPCGNSVIFDPKSVSCDTPDDPPPVP